MDKIRVSVPFEELQPKDRVCYKTRKGVGGGGVESLLLNEDGTIKAFRLVGEVNKGAYYHKHQFVTGHRDVPLRKKKDPELEKLRELRDEVDTAHLDYRKAAGGYSLAVACEELESARYRYQSACQEYVESQLNKENTNV